MTHAVFPEPNASWIELDAGALEHNVALFREVLRGSDSQRGSRLGGVLKGNAYGHGFEVILERLHPLLDVIYVIMAADALFVRDFERHRKLPPRQVVVIGTVNANEVVALATEGIQCVVGDAHWHDSIAALRMRGGGIKAQVHVHVDTGLGREGFLPDSISRDLGFLVNAADVIEPVGVLTHFANTEDVTEQTYARHQLAEFNKGFAALQALFPKSHLERHCAASAATLLVEDARLDVARVGIALYGLWPSNETRISAKLMHPNWGTLRPVLSWRCKSQLVKALPAGSFIGYGCSFRCDRDTLVAVLPVGYFDGYPRVAAARAHVLVNGRRCPVIGRVMMNHIIVDITSAAPGASEVTATLVGCDGAEAISAETLAGWAQTINYEIVTRLAPHLRRKFV